MQPINSNEKYIITILPQINSMYTPQETKNLQFETVETSNESTRIDNNNSKYQSRFENDFSVKHFLFSKLKAFELVSEFKEEELSDNVFSENNEESDPYYDESLLSNAFDSQRHHP